MLATDSPSLTLERKYMPGTFDESKHKYMEESLAESKSYSDSELQFRIVPVGFWILEKNQYLKQIVDLRNQNSQQYFHSDSVSLQSTLEYFEKTVLPDSSRIWFLILDLDSNFLGHFGYSNFQPLKRSATLDSVAKVTTSQLKMKEVLENSFSNFLPQLGIHKLSLEVLSSNQKAIALYEKLGFRAEPESQITRMGKNGTSMSLLLLHS